MNIEKTILNFRRNGYSVNFFKSQTEATDYLAANINKKNIGFGDSKTLVEIDLYQKLCLNNQVISPQECIEPEDFISVAKECLTTDIFITSANAVTENGEIVNMDGTGNRIAGSLFGHEKVYFVIGVNKIVPTLEKAISRTRNVAAPLNAKRLELKTPCAKEGNHCYDCSSPERICNGMVIHYKKMNDINMEIVIIDDSLGF